MAIGGTTFGQSRASKLSLLLGNDTGSSASLMSPRILMRCLETKKSVQVGHSVLVPTEFTVLNMTDAMALHQAPSLLGHSLMLSPVREELPFEVSGFMNCPAIKARWLEQTPPLLHKPGGEPILRMEPSTAICTYIRIKVIANVRCWCVKPIALSQLL